MRVERSAGGEQHGGLRTRTSTWFFCFLLCHADVFERALWGEEVEDCLVSLPLVGGGALEVTVRGIPFLPHGVVLISKLWWGRGLGETSSGDSFLFSVSMPG